MRRLLAAATLICTIFLVPSISYAKAGIVAFIDDDVIVVSTNRGFTCAEIIGVTLAEKGDVIYGIQDTYGSQTWTWENMDSDFSVFVDEFWLDVPQANAWLRQNRR